MVYALEGADLVGKSTLLKALCTRLVGHVFVPAMPLTQELFKSFSAVEARDEAHWWALHDPESDYVCDRHVAVSAPVYDRVHCRQELVDWKRWVPYITVIYLVLPLPELNRRIAARGDEFFNKEKYATLLQEYDKHVANFNHHVVDASRPDLVDHVAKLIGA